jgi:hypothetical protein
MSASSDRGKKMSADRARAVRIIELAWQNRYQDDDIEIDDDACISESDGDNEVWIEAWGKFDLTGTEFDKEPVLVFHLNHRRD